MSINNKPTFTMMVGVAGSGKSTIAFRIAEDTGAKIVSSDAIRGEIYGDENCQANPAKIFEIVHQRVRNHLKNGESVIMDATNLNCKRRMNFVKTLSHFDCFKNCVLVITAPEDIEVRMEMRARKVPMGVVHNQISQFQCPNYYEGWDNISIEYNSELPIFRESFRKIWKECDIPHDNPHHSLSVKEHLDKAADIAEGIVWEKGNGDLVQERWVARIHDIGKPRCKTFTDREGNPTEVAHYRNHQNYGAYYSLVFDGTDDNVYDHMSLDNACLIQWHMEHYLRKGESLKRFYEMIGSKLSRRLHILEEADKRAH